MAMEVARGKRGEAPGTVTFLSGDVHHSYVAEVAARRTGAGSSRIIQAVCSPIRNPLPPQMRVRHRGAGLRRRRAARPARRALGQGAGPRRSLANLARAVVRQQLATSRTATTGCACRGTPASCTATRHPARQRPGRSPTTPSPRLDGRGRHRGPAPVDAGGAIVEPGSSLSPAGGVTCVGSSLLERAEPDSASGPRSRRARPSRAFSTTSISAGWIQYCPRATSCAVCPKLIAWISGWIRLDGLRRRGRARRASARCPGRRAASRSRWCPPSPSRTPCRRTPAAPPRAGTPCVDGVLLGEPDAGHLRVGEHRARHDVVARAHQVARGAAGCAGPPAPRGWTRA